MSRFEERLVWFLADPSVASTEFDAVAEWLCQGGIDKVIRRASAIRKSAHKIARKHVSRRSSRASVREQASADDPVVSTLERLLLHESNLTVRRALSSLSDGLNARRPMPAKMSFAAGVKRLLAEFDASTVVSTAQRLRNSIVHQTPNVPDMSWPLHEDV